jgi:hypothetical protein
MPEVSAHVNALVRRAVETNARYYRGLFALATIYLRELGDLLADGRRSFVDRPVAPEGARKAPVMVLEAAAGEHARGLFIVENKLDRALTAKVVASTCRHPVNGQELIPNIRFEPNELTLGPGEQATVLAVATIDDRMEPGVTYSATFAVPGLAERVVHVALRRHAPVGHARPVRSKRVARKHATRGARAPESKRAIQPETS